MIKAVDMDCVGCLFVSNFAVLFMPNGWMFDLPFLSENGAQHLSFVVLEA